MGNVRVDVVMATNRVSAYLDDTLESVMAQTFPHWRLTVVDDGVPDINALAAKVSAVPRSQVFRQPHRGLPAARNVGIARTSAPLIALLDDDDLWEPDKLRRQVQALDESPDALAAFTAGQYIDGNGRLFGAGWPAATVDSRFFVTGGVPPPRIVTLMVRRSAHELIGRFNESYTQAEDNEYILRLALQGALVGVSEPLVRYRRHDSNMSSPGSIDGRRANLRLLREQLEVHQADPEIVDQLQQHRRLFKRTAADEWLRSLRYALGNRQLRRALSEVTWAVSSAPVASARTVVSRVFSKH